MIILIIIIKNRYHHLTPLFFFVVSHPPHKKYISPCYPNTMGDYIYMFQFRLEKIEETIIAFCVKSFFLHDYSKFVFILLKLFTTITYPYSAYHFMA